MPSKSMRLFGAWSNYNLTAGDPLPPLGTRGLTVENLHSLHCSDLDTSRPFEAMGRTAQLLSAYLAELRSIRHGQQPTRMPPRNFRAATVGQAWSFAPLVGTPVAQLLGEGLSWSSRAFGGKLAAGCKSAPDRLVIAGGGTRLRELLAVAEQGSPALSLPTGGSHLGQSLAGACATGTHGSRLGRGGLQNIVRAMHIVTGPDSHVWLQRADDPVLDENAMRDIAFEIPVEGTRASKRIACTLVSDNAHFDNALIHLGAMGIVNAMVIELEEKEAFDVFAIARPIDRGWLQLLDQGDFAGLAKRLGFGKTPLEFYELTFDPHQPFSAAAAHLIYTRAAGECAAGGPRPAVADSIAGIGSQLLADPARHDGLFADLHPESADKAATAGGPLDPAVKQILRTILAQSQSESVFEHYRKGGAFRPVSGPIDPSRDRKTGGSWADIHGDAITGGIPGSLYNASFAIARQDTGKAIAAITQAVEGLAPSFVFTLRFVTDAAGTLAFTRFGENTVIEIDGLSAFAIDLARRSYVADEKKAGRQPNPHALAAFSLLSTTLERGAYNVRTALARAGVDYSMHWAKLGDLDASKVAADYGDRIARWRSTRDHLLGEEERVFFGNDAVETYGLVPKLREYPATG